LHHQFYYAIIIPRTTKNVNGKRRQNMSNQGNYNEIDSLNIKIVASGITYVDIPFDTSWRILPYTVLTSIKKIPTEIAGSSICEFANGETRVFAPGTSIIIPRNVKHRFTNTVDPHTAVWIHWDVTIDLNLDIFNFCEIPPIIRGENSHKIMECCSVIAQTNVNELQGIIKVKSLLYSLLDIVLSECRLLDKYYNFKSTYRTYIPIINYIDANLSHKLVLSDIAKFSSCSVSKMQRSFFSTFGIPIGDFIIKRRLNQVPRLICSGNMTLKEIAEKIGFTDAFSLSKSFKKCFGVSPREYKSISMQKKLNNP